MMKDSEFYMDKNGHAFAVTAEVDNNGHVNSKLVSLEKRSNKSRFALLNLINMTLIRQMILCRTTF